MIIGVYIVGVKLVVDNSDKFWDNGLEEYTDDPSPTEFPYMVNDHLDEVTAMFQTWKEAALYQIGMGIRANTTIEFWED